MLIDLLAFGAIGLAALLGARRGTVAMALALGALVAGYAAALLLHRPFGALLGGVFSLSPLLALPLGGLLAFALAAGAVRLYARRLRSEREERVDGGWEPTPGDRWGGAILGGTAGGVVVLVLAWGFTALSGVRSAGPPVQAPPSASAAGSGAPGSGTAGSGVPAAREESRLTRNSLVAGLGESAAERTVSAAVRIAGGDRATARATGAVVARPAEARDAMRTLTDPEKLGDLDVDDAFVRAFAEGDGQALARHPGLRRYLSDPEVREAARALGLEVTDPDDPDALAREVGEALAPVGGTIETLRHDPEFMAVVERSRIRERLEAGQIVGLANDPDVAWIMGRVREEMARQRGGGR